jgi:hypothetical protein
MVLQACPDFALFARHGVSSWRDVLSVAGASAPNLWLGILVMILIGPLELLTLIAVHRGRSQSEPTPNSSGVKKCTPVG